MNTWNSIFFLEVNDKYIQLYFFQISDDQREYFEDSGHSSEFSEQSDPESQKVEMNKSNLCDTCGKECGTIKQLKYHMIQVHKVPVSR